MKTIDFSPLLRSSVGFDRLTSLLDSSLRADQNLAGHPPYNIEVLDENRYQISLAVAGYDESDLDIQMGNGVLTVKGQKTESNDDKERRFLHRGITHHNFERKYNLADHVEVVNASLQNGLLRIELVRDIPEAMKPKTIPIQVSRNTLEHKADDTDDTDDRAAA